MDFQVECSCGATLNGQRGDRPQILPCPTCRTPLFVYPRTPWMDLVHLRTTSAEKMNRLRPRDMVLPIGAGVVTLIGLLLLYFLVVHPWLVQPAGNAHVAKEAAKPEILRQRLAQAQQMLKQGHYRLAQQSLKGYKLEALAPEERRTWDQLALEAGLLADLVAEPLEDLLKHAAGSSPEEWQAEFAQRYQGKSFIIDAEFRWLAGRGWLTNYQLGLPPEVARVAWEDAQILTRVPAKEKRRLILGVRLAKMELVPPGPTWVFRLQPDQGVLMTEAEAVSLCCPGLTDPDSAKVFAEQRSWLHN